MGQVPVTLSIGASMAGVGSVGGTQGSLQTQAVQRKPEAPEVEKADNNKDGDSDHGSAKAAPCYLLEAFDLSGFVARNLSGRHSALKGVRNETDGAATGDPEDEIRRSV